MNIWKTTRFTTQHTVITIDDETGVCNLSYIHSSCAKIVKQFKDINDAASFIRKHGAIGGFKDGNRENGRNVILFTAHWQIWNDGFWESSGSDFAKIEDIHNDDGDGNWQRLRVGKPFNHKS